MTKVTVHVLSTCIPDENEPCLPSVFGTLAEAETQFAEFMRSEWEHNAPDDGDGKPPFPDDPNEAHDKMSENNPDWGRYEISTHRVDVPIVGKMLAMLDRIHSALDTSTPETLAGNTAILFDEIGCLIAEAKGEYNPDDPATDVKTQNGTAFKYEELKEAFGFRVGQFVTMTCISKGEDHEGTEHTVAPGGKGKIDRIERLPAPQGINITVVIETGKFDADGDMLYIVNSFDEEDGHPTAFFH
ncbi:hypothetical protein ACRQ5Q_14670 [Bradyrhizobium sp. PMVTL-01]|uniref:hypothetical protein n=1 Tax=Bradyrhizobium sp. PMVTL-01 TaxID=3434999 RepID=UPI003F7127E5